MKISEKKKFLESLTIEELAKIAKMLDDSKDSK